MTTSPTATAPVPPPPPATDAQAYLAHPRFHQTFTLPATESHGALVFSYAEAGREGTTRRGRGRGREGERRGENDEPVVEDGEDNEEEEEEDIPTVLLIPGMFASRYIATWPAVHAVAAGMGVRVLAVDRPGLGSSTAVPLAQRVPVWLELVPALLRHLGIRHVALVSHSAGTIYALNTLYRCRDVLHPKRPLVVLLGKCGFPDPSSPPLCSPPMRGNYLLNPPLSTRKAPSSTRPPRANATSSSCNGSRHPPSPSGTGSRNSCKRRRRDRWPSAARP